MSTNDETKARRVRLKRLGQDKLVDMIFDLQASLAESNAKFVEVLQYAFTDQLTGLLSRWGLKDAIRRLSAEIKRAAQNNRVFDNAMLLMDLDGFKMVNDTHGHPAGDAVLIAVADLMRRSFRGSDILGRWGGDEFMVILSNTGTEQAESIAEHFLQAIRDSFVLKQYRLTASIGIFVFNRNTPISFSDPTGFETYYRAADQCLLRAKRGGKDGLTIYGIV